MKKRKYKILVFMIFATIISNVLGLLRELLLAYKYGTSEIVDVYIVSTNIPITLFTVWISAIVTSYIPISSKIGNDPLRQMNYTHTLINLVLLINTILFIILFIFTEPIVKIFALGFEGTKFSLTVELTKIMLLGIFPTGIYMVLQNYLNYKEKYIAVSFIGSILNITWIAGILFSSENFTLPFAIFNLLSYFIVCTYIFFMANRNGYRYKMKIIINEEIKQTFKMFIPIITLLIITQSNVIIERTLASLGDQGAIPILNYSSRLVYVVYGLLVLTMFSYFNPKIAKIYYIDKDEFRKAATNILIICLILLTPITVLVAIFSKEIVDIVYNRGAFSENDIFFTALSLEIFILSLIPLALKEYYNKLFYIKEKTNIPLLNTVIFVLLNISLSTLFIVIMNLSFISLVYAATIANILSLIIYTFFVIKYKFLYLNKIYIFTISNILIVNVILYLISKAIKSFNYISSPIENLFLIFLYIIVYLIYLKIFNIKNYIKQAMKL